MNAIDRLLALAQWRPVDLARAASLSPGVICDLRKGRKKHVNAESARRIRDAFAKKIGASKIPPGFFERLCGVEPLSRGARQ